MKNIVKNFELRSNASGNISGNIHKTPKDLFIKPNIVTQKSEIFEQSTKKPDKQHKFTKLKQLTNSKMFIGILQGLFVFAIMFLFNFYILSWRYEVQLVIATPISFLVALVISFAFTLSMAFRCVAALSATMITSQQGRAILLSIVTGLLVGGPLINIMHNTNEASVTISCIADLAEEQGTALASAYKVAYIDMTKSLLDNIQIWKKVGDGIQTALEPIRSGFESARENFKVAKQKLEGAASNCRKGIDQAYSTCTQGAEESKIRCKNSLPSWSGIKNTITKPFEDVGQKIGQPFKDFFGRKKRSPGDLNEICNVIAIGNTVCQPLKSVNVCGVIDAAKIIALDKLSKVIDLFNNFVELFNFKMSVDNSHSGKLNYSTNGTEIKQQIKKEFQENYAGILYAVSIVQIILILPIFMIPISSGLYLHKFLKCREAGKSNSLSKFVKRQKTGNNRNLIFHLIQLGTHILLSLTVFCFDYTLFWIESVVKKHGNATFSAEGTVKLTFNTQGGPILKPFIDEFAKTFTLERIHNFTINTDHCLPEPISQNGWSSIIIILVIYIFCFVFVFTEFYIASKRPSIVNYFYQDKGAIKTKQIDKKYKHDLCLKPLNLKTPNSEKVEKPLLYPRRC